MIKTSSFCILGGDKRQVSMAASMASEGHKVYLAGFDNINTDSDIINCSLIGAIENSENIILPIPVTKDKLTLNAPFYNSKIFLDNNFIENLRGKKVFCSLKESLIESNPKWKEINMADYSSREEFAVDNAIPTAEGAIEIATRESPGTINGSNCLVSGFGRIGKVLAFMLNGMGAKVTVSARKHQDLSWIKLFGYTPIHTYKIYSIKQYNIIFNTIPKLIFDSNILASFPNDSIIIDIASAPGGIDFDQAQKLGIKVIHALSLPGKVAPKEAGEIIKRSIYNIIEEDGIWKG